MMAVPTSVTKRNAMRYCVLVLGFVFVPVLLLGQETPRFRAGANLVRVDAYVSQDDAAITDLKAEDFTVYEDDKPQRIENFELIRARGPIPQHERRDTNNTRDMRQAVNDAARVFTLFFDPLYTSTSGSYYLQKPLVETFDKVIGPDDMVGAMTPDMPPSTITYSSRTESIERFVTKYWMWGQRDVRWPTFNLPGGSPNDNVRNDEFAGIGACYPATDKENFGIARKMIERLKEQKTLRALEGLILHLEGLRQERKFVMVFTEGWPLYGPDQSLSKVLEGRGPLPDPLGTEPGTGRLRPQGGPEPVNGVARSWESCERLRIELAQVDHERDFQRLLQRANRANVSFYPVDARGLLVSDRPTSFDTLPSDDQAMLRRRHGFLKEMADQTDGYAVLDTGQVAAGLQKVFRDVGSYYLMSYYSTNTRLDGRFRRIRVDVNRRGADVRARPGYLAPTEAEARAANAMMTTAPASNLAPTVSRALDSLAPTRGALPARIQATGGPGTIGAIIELDPATLKQPEWLTGGTARVSFEADDRNGTVVPPMVVAIEPGQRSITLNASNSISAGKYVVRAEIAARGSRLPIQVSTPVDVAAADAAIGSAALAYRRGPSTGLAYVPTADARFRRTERLRIEVPISADGVTAVGRLLTREGQALPLNVVYQQRRDDAAGRSFGQAEVILSPLAAGDYVFELTFTAGADRRVVAYGFRIVP